MPCEIKKPGTFEGGDFLPMNEFALLGVGDRSNMFGVEQIIKYGLGYSEVGVVHQPKHPLIPENKTDSHDEHAFRYLLQCCFRWCCCGL